MYKFFVIAVVIAVAAARPQQYGHPFSAQSILLHAGDGHEVQAPLYNSLAAINQHQNNAAAHYQQYDQHQTDYYAYPRYGFEYKVQDPHTGDNKYQHETRDGDVVKGVYSLHEADGTIRIVEYSADKHSGFNAIVRREGHAQHIQPEIHGHY